MARPGIMIYFDMLGPIRVLPDADKGRLLVAMLEYGQEGKLPRFDGMLALAWESISMSSTRLPRAARAADKFTAVVVLPTPPFWFAMAMTFTRGILPDQGIFSSCIFHTDTVGMQISKRRMQNDK